MDTKICSKCKEEKELKDFDKQKRGKFGTRSVCKICTSVYRKVYHKRPDVKERFNKWHKKYRLERKEEYNLYDKQFRNKYHKTLEGYSSKLFSNAKSRAKKKNFEFDLTSKWVFNKLEPLVCEATGFEMNIASGKNCKTNPLQPTIDRIDSFKGYTKDNVRVVCWWWNVMKQDWSDELIIDLINKYKNEKS